MRTRRYDSYEAYTAKQREKTIVRKHLFGAQWNTKVRRFKALFDHHLCNHNTVDHTQALCLGARHGEEVEALNSLGWAAVGVDLVACPPLVQAGDFHALPFSESMFDLVFSNSVDHLLEPEKFATEIHRVLRPQGLVLLHLQIEREGDEWSSLKIEASSEVISWFPGYKLLRDQPILRYGGGLDHCVLLKRPVALDNLVPVTAEGEKR